MLQVSVKEEGKEKIVFARLHNGQQPGSLTDHKPDGTNILLFGVQGNEAFLVISKQGYSNEMGNVREVVSFKREVEIILKKGETHERKITRANGQEVTLILEYI